MDSWKNKTLLKVIILGDSGVGKTSILESYVRQEFKKKYKATVGVDFFKKELCIDGTQVTMQLWDTAGQERYSSCLPSVFHNVDCCIIACDVTRQDAFKSVEKWRNVCLCYSGIIERELFPMIIVGNKIDLNNERTVGEEEGFRRCEATWPGLYSYIETSATDRLNVEELFEIVAKKAFEWHSSEGDRDCFSLKEASGNEKPVKKGCAC